MFQSRTPVPYGAAATYHLLLASLTGAVPAVILLGNAGPWVHLGTRKVGKVYLTDMSLSVIYIGLTVSHFMAQSWRIP